MSRPYHHLWLHLPSNTSWIFTVMTFKVNQIRSIGKRFKHISLGVTGDIRFLSAHVYYTYLWLVKFILFIIFNEVHPFVSLLCFEVSWCHLNFSAQSISVCNTGNFSSSKPCTVFSAWFPHTGFDLYRDVPKYFIYVMLVTSDYSFICSLFIYVQRIVFQHFIPHFCVSVYFRNICISFLSTIEVEHLPSSINLSFSELSIEIMLQYCRIFSNQVRTRI